jgi:hypothetical protein
MNNLTKNQEKLIEQIKNEFLAMNQSETSSSFADLILNEIDDTRIEFASINSKSYALFEELHAQHLKNLEYLKTECAKLRIGVEDKGLSFKDTSQYCTSTITLLHPSIRDYDISISVRIPTRYHSKSGLRTWELYSTIKYGISVTSDLDHMYEFNMFINKDNFKERVTTLYHRINQPLFVSL